MARAWLPAWLERPVDVGSILQPWGNAGGALKPFLDWWKSHLAASVPKGLAAWFGFESYLHIDLIGDDIIMHRRVGQDFMILWKATRKQFETGERRVPLAITELLARRVPVMIGVDPKHIFLRSVQLPVAAERALKTLLSYEIERFEPLPVDQIHFDCRVLERDPVTGKLLVSLAVIRRRTIDEIFALTGLLNCEVKRIAVLEANRRYGFNLLPKDRIRTKWPLSRKAAIALGISTVFFALACFAAAISQQERQLDLIKREIASEQPLARQASDLQTKIEARRAQLTLIPAKTQEPRMVEIIDNLSKSLPDNTWIFRFEANGDAVRISGYSSAAFSLLDAIGKVPIFKDIAFSSPVVQGPSQKLDRFEISFKVRKE